MIQGLQVFLRDEVQELIDALAHTFGVRITLFSPAMDELRVGLQNPGSDFCHMVQGPLRRLHQCQLMDRQMCRRAEHLDRMAAYRCHAGLLEAVLPLRSGSQIVGYLMVGQFRDTEVPSDEVLDPRTLDHPEEQPLLDAFRATPFLDPVSQEKMLTLASMLVQFFVSQGFVGIRRTGVMEAVADWVSGNLDQELRIDEVARILGKSTSTVARAVKEATGRSFRQFVQLKRVERFETLVRTRPDLRIGEAALQAGFADSLYFSRVYRQIRGRTPREFRQELYGALPTERRDEARSTNVPWGF